MNLAWWLETGAWDFPDKPAVIDPDGTPITYGELNTLANRVGNELRERWGIGEDDVVVTLAGEHHGHVAVMFGLWKIGAVFCPLNRTQTLKKFVHDVAITEPKLLLVDPRFADMGRQLMTETAIHRVALLDDAQGELPSFTNTVPQASNELQMTPRANSDLAIINFTTGTTGPSKGAMLPHGAMITSFLGGVHWSGMRSSETVICPLYMFHTGGISVLMTGLVARATVVLVGEPWNSDRFLDLMERYRPDWVFLMVPVMTRDLARNPRFANFDATGVKLYLAGEPVTAEVQKLWEDRGAKTLILYGMTESMAVCVTCTSFYYSEEEKIGKALTGIPNREFCEVKLIDPLTGEEITEPHVQGEICFRGDVRTPGYYHDPARTKQAIDADGWFHTFDLGYRNEHGQFTVGGRTDDIISSGGEKLALLEVESAILQAPFVKDAACIGVPHERFGQSPAAFVVASEEMTEDELMQRLHEFLLRDLERWKRPRLYIKLDAIPRTVAKQTKIWPKLRELVAGITLTGDGATTYGACR
ncbi:MAG: class I adenylate-forming enzyme family protein [Planctomycetaceae bacterium]